MVFEPALTRQDWLGLAALSLLTIVLVGSACVVLATAARRSRAAFLSLLAICLVCGFGVGKVLMDRLGAFCEVEFTEREAIVRGLASTVRLPLEQAAGVELTVDGVRLVSGSDSALLPQAAEWELGGSLVVGADFLANEFAGRAR
jgi:hypothetical protein